MKRGLNKKNRKSLRSHNDHRSHFEHLEHRQLLSAALTVNNPLLVFNAVKGSGVSPTETIIFTNTGDAALSFGSGAFSLIKDPAISSNDTARFSLLNASSAPASLAPGQNFTLNINYNANAIINNSAILDVSTNDAVHPVQVITLHGIGTQGLGGTNQPSLARILRAYDIPTIVGQGPNDSNAATDSNWPTAANPVDPSSQEVVAQRFVKAGTGPVSIDVLASFTASGFSKSYELGTYPAGNPTDLSELFYTTSTENQTTFVQPQGATSFDPGTNPFGFYFVSNVQTKGRIGYSEDALNTWDSTTGRHMRFYPMENPNGSIVPNTYIMTSTEWNAPVGYDFTNIVAVVSNITIAPNAPTAPVLTLQNANALPGSTNMVFDRIANPNTVVGDVVHDTGVLNVTDTGGSPLVINSYSLSSQWTLVNPPAFPLTINPGKSVPLTIKFIANSEPSVPYNETNDIYYPSGGGVYDGTLTLNTNDPANSKSVTQLTGYYQFHSENSNEPGLQTIVNLLAGWGTNISSTQTPDLTESSATGATPTYYGEEVVSAYWQEADPGQSVTVQALDSFHTEGNTATTSWFVKGSSSNTKLFTTASDDGQTLFPFATGTTTPAAASFTTTSAFGFNLDGESSDDSKNGLKTGGGHHVRFYPLRTAAGVLVPNTYIVAMDYSNTPQNFDFQDNVYIVSNIRPAIVNAVSAPQTTAAPPTPADFYAAGTQSGVSLEWAAVSDSTLKGYNVYRSSSQNGTYTLLTPKVISATSYFDTSAPAGPEFYKVTAFDSTTLTESLAAFSHTTALITSTTVPPAPGNLTATGITGGVSLTWSAVADPTLDGYDVSSSSSASGPFTLLTPSVITTTSFTDSSATIGATTFYQVTAVDASSGLSSTPSTTSGTALAVVGGLQSIDIGASPSGSTTLVTPGTDYNVTAGGPGIAANADGFRFLYQTQSGDFDMKVQVQSLTVAGNYSTAGILARSALTTTSADVYMSASPVNYRFKYRTATAGVNNVVAGAATSFPGAWVRLTRVGNLFTGYSSTDGVHWTAVSSITIALPTTLYLGLGVASNVTTQTTTTQLRSYGATNVTVPTPPPTPANFAATGIQGGVSLSWASVADATLKGYNVYSSSSSSGPFTKLTSSPITATGFTDNSAVVGQATFYEVTAVDASSGLESSPASASGTALAVAVNPPPTPANFTANGIQGGVSLSWSAVADATLKGYNVYSSSSSSGPFTKLTSSPITPTTFTDTSAVVGQTTFYEVTSVDASSGLESTPANASGTALAVVNNGLTSVDIGASPSGSTTVINPGTDYNVTAGGPGIAANADGFRFLYQTQSGDFDVKVQVASITVAGNYATAGILARTSLTTTSPDVYMSASPVNYRFKYRTSTAGVNNIAVSANTSFPGAWVRLVRVGNLFTGYSSTDGVNWTTVSSISIALPSTLFLGLGVASNNNTQTTTTQLRSYGPTNGVTATPPAMPANLTASGIQGGVSLAWSAVADATLKGYNVYSSSSSGGTYTKLTSSPITATTFNDTSAVVGQTTFYKVTAIDASSGLESAAATASATALAVVAAPPAAPTNVSATDVQGGVSFSWSVVVDATLQGYNVYSSSSPSGTFSLLTSSPIASTTFTDTSAVFGVTTYYHVTAVDASSGLESAPTAVTATGLQSVDIGATPSGSTTVVTPGSAYNVTAGGPGVANNADGFRFIYEAFTGNFDLKVQVQSITVAGNYATAGILARTSLTTTSPDIYMSASPVNYRFKYRTTVGGVNNIAVAGTTSFPGAWVRLSRVGNVFTGYYSTDGVNWTVASTYTLALPNTLYLGLAVASNVSTTTTSAVLSDFSTT